MLESMLNAYAIKLAPTANKPILERTDQCTKESLEPLLGCFLTIITNLRKYAMTMVRLAENLC